MNRPPLAADAAIPDSRGINLFEHDPAFDALLRVYLPEPLHTHLRPTLRDLGARAGDTLDRLAASADKHPPVLSHRTRSGVDCQTIDKHPDYVALENVAFGELGLAAMSHTGGVLGWPEPLPPIAKYALTFLFVQAEFGLCCPVSMTDALTRTLRKFGEPALIERFLPALVSQDLDTLCQGAMFMTEQGAGSDVGGVTTRAVRDAHGAWRLSGDKWFCSNADAGLAMVLARPDGAPDGIKGLGLFLLPKYLPDGSRNHYRIVRLKDKLGSRSMASGEIRLEGALAYPVGDLTQGFKQMTDMINMSRLSNGVRAAGLMRRAVGEALYTARHRSAFGRRLIDMPLMRRQLVKMLVPAEQARSMFMHIAHCLAQADGGDARAQQLLRILTPMIKFRACRDARKVTGDAMEVRGGCGYIEEWSDPRLVRDAHLGSIWEGTSNIVALDIARAVKREGALVPLRAYLRELLAAPGIPAAAVECLGALAERACAAIDHAAQGGHDAQVRQAGSALYHATTAVFMAWEAAHQAPDSRRLALALLVARHRLAPRDPLAIDTDTELENLFIALLGDASIDATRALQALPA